jgi:hypothetical protein
MAFSIEFGSFVPSFFYSYRLHPSFSFFHEFTCAPSLFLSPLNKALMATALAVLLRLPPRNSRKPRRECDQRASANLAAAREV